LGAVGSGDSHSLFKRDVNPAPITGTKINLDNYVFLNYFLRLIYVMGGLEKSVREIAIGT